MSTILLLNLFLVLLAVILPNDFLIWDSYVLYAAQALTMIPFVLSRTVYVKNLFLPTFFVLVYSLVNLAFGSYLVPRGFGWDKQFADVATNIQNYNRIVPFLLASNIVLFWLTLTALRDLALADAQWRSSTHNEPASSESLGLAKMLLYIPLFFAVSYLDIYSALSFLLAILILHLTDPWLKRSLLRYAVYIYYLVVLAAFDFGNKREIAIVLFLIIFLEAYHRGARLAFTPKAIAAYIVASTSFFGLILTASILRGYGDFPVSTIFGAIADIPRYMTSNMFIDGITDNLELNYNYGVAITAIDQTLRGLIHYQYGASLIKVLFLPIPRDALPFKPDSIMQLFTRIYAPDWWSEQGSMPVRFAAEMFLNFSYLGLVGYAVIWACINKLFLTFHTATPRSFVACSCLFLCITVLMFARGSGLEEWLLYYFLATPLLLLFRICGKRLQMNDNPELRWLV